MGRKKRNAWVRRDTRYAQILLACVALERRGKRPTVASIAREIGMSVSGHLRAIIYDVVDLGYLHRLDEVHWNGRDAKVFLVNHEALQSNCPEWFKQVRSLIGVQRKLEL